MDASESFTPIVEAEKRRYILISSLAKKWWDSMLDGCMMKKLILKYWVTHNLLQATSNGAVAIEFALARY